MAHPGSWLRENHPEWFEGDFIKFGDCTARKGITNYIDQIIKKEGIDCYRQDFAGNWPADTADRQGINENKYVTGMIAFWDELLRRNPNLLVDMCSGGGRRNDLEAMRRAIPLWYSDNIGHTVGIQGKTYGIAFWLPCFGTMVSSSLYEFRSRMTPYIIADVDFRRDLNYELLRSMVRELRAVSLYYLGDYYPLTPYSIEDDTWLAWQFNCPGLGEGMVQVFARSLSYIESARFKLRDLEPKSTYIVKNMDEPDKDTKMSGRDMMEKGVQVEVLNKPAAVIITYKRFDLN